MKGRYAPSPTGNLHLGNAATALWAWLEVRTAGGRFVLRMDDLDVDRSRPEFVQQQLEDLYWLGIDWDEGPDVGGPNGPYFQQQRTDLYEAAFRKLEEAGRIYPCYCSRKDLLEAASAPHGPQAGYPGTCRGLAPAEQARRAAQKDPSFRFIYPGEEVSFADGLLGPQHFPPGYGGDFIVKRADGLFAYQLATVVDDAAMGITRVSRGADLLDSSPRQIALYRALDLPVPEFTHYPLWLGPDGARLSKRHGSVTLRELREGGMEASRLRGQLAAAAGLISAPRPLAVTDLPEIFLLENMKREPHLWAGGKS